MAKTEAIKIKEGSSKKIELAGNATTGYQWVAFPDKVDMVEIKKAFVKKEGEKKLLGAGSKEVFTISALKKGKVKIFFRQIKPWEKQTQPAGEVLYDIIIE